MTDLDDLQRLADLATPGPWLQGNHVGEPRALCAERSLLTSLLALDADGMAAVALKLIAVAQAAMVMVDEDRKVSPELSNALAALGE